MKELKKGYSDFPQRVLSVKVLFYRGTLAVCMQGDPFSLRLPPKKGSN